MKPPPLRFWLAALLIVAGTLRLVLVGCGGQFFFGDEGRHARGVALYDAVRHGDVAGMRAAFSRPEHIGFTVLGAGLTGLQHLGAQCTRWSDWSRPEAVLFTFGIGAGWLAMFSVVNIWLVYRLAASAGATAAEAAWAALLMACSNTGFYFSRHFLPYDAALTVALVAVWVGLHGRRSFWCGLLAGAAYHTYNGYWYLVPVVLALHCGGAEPGGRPRWSRLVQAAAGAGLAVALPIAFGIALAGRGYWETMIAFSGTVNQGAYREGWSLPWEYFWHSEGGLGVAVFLTIAAAAVAARPWREAADRRAGLWLAAAFMSYAWLVLLSVGLEKFVVYARSLKPLVPFLCLAGGWAVNRLLARHPPGAARLAAAACCVAAGANFLPQFGLIFPADVEQRVVREIGNPKHSLSVAGSLYVPLALPVARPELVLVNAQLLYPVRSYLGYPPGTVVFSVPHPLSYLPFQYESHNPRERALLRAHEISIRLIRLAEPATVPDDLPPPLRFTVADRPDGRR